MNNIKKAVVAIFVNAALFFGLAHAADAPKAPSGTVTVDIKILGLAAGDQSLSKGILTYKGKQYPFSISGINLDKNATGAAQVTASGKVFDLADLVKFSGAYIQTAGGIGPVVGGKATLKNQNGVTLQMEGMSDADTVISKNGLMIKLAQ